MVTKLEQLFGAVDAPKSLELSYRSQIVDQIIQESIKTGDKVLVFSHSIPTLDYLEHILKQGKRRYSRLDGQTPISSRQAATKNFNKVSSDMQVYLISTRAGGLGLNIPGANRVVIFDFQFNPTWEEQAVGRAYRLGQQKPVFVYRFIAGGTFEDVVHNKAVFKTQLSFRVVDKKNPVRWASRPIKEYLFHPKPVKQKDLSEYHGKDPAVLDRILSGGFDIRQIALTETFQREDNDTLTPEEERDVQAELDDERLKRKDPVAWAKKQKEKETRQAATLSISQSWPAPSPGLFHQTPPAFSTNPLFQAQIQSLFSGPTSAINNGPHSLTPDTSPFTNMVVQASRPIPLAGSSLASNITTTGPELQRTSLEGANEPPCSPHSEPVLEIRGQSLDSISNRAVDPASTSENGRKSNTPALELALQAGKEKTQQPGDKDIPLRDDPASPSPTEDSKSSCRQQ
jgi:superfamily II DNA/RNA helicase